MSTTTTPADAVKDVSVVVTHSADQTTIGVESGVASEIPTSNDLEQKEAMLEITTKLDSIAELSSNVEVVDELDINAVNAALGAATIPVASAAVDTDLSVSQEAQKEAMLEITTKLNAIEEKSSCGSVMFLDKVADFLERRSIYLHNLSLRVRNRTVKMSAPCSIIFKKK